MIGCEGQEIAVLEFDAQKLRFLTKEGRGSCDQVLDRDGRSQVGKATLQGSMDASWQTSRVIVTLAEGPQLTRLECYFQRLLVPYGFSERLRASIGLMSFPKQ